MAENESTSNWRRSSFSGGENNDCVEVARDLNAVRDSKHPDVRLRANVQALVAALGQGSFDR